MELPFLVPFLYISRSWVFVNLGPGITEKSTICYCGKLFVSAPESLYYSAVKTSQHFKRRRKKLKFSLWLSLIVHTKTPTQLAAESGAKFIF